MSYPCFLSHSLLILRVSYTGTSHSSTSTKNEPKSSTYRWPLSKCTLRGAGVMWCAGIMPLLPSVWQQDPQSQGEKVRPPCRRHHWHCPQKSAMCLRRGVRRKKSGWCWSICHCCTRCPRWPASFPHLSLWPTAIGSFQPTSPQWSGTGAAMWTQGGEAHVGMQGCVPDTEGLLSMSLGACIRSHTPIRKSQNGSMTYSTQKGSNVCPLSSGPWTLWAWMGVLQGQDSKSNGNNYLLTFIWSWKLTCLNVVFLYFTCSAF